MREEEWRGGLGSNQDMAVEMIRKGRYDCLFGISVSIH